MTWKGEIEDLGPDEIYSSRVLYRPEPGSTEWFVLVTKRQEVGVVPMGTICSTCQRYTSRPFLTEQEVRHQLRDLNIQGPLLICPTCHHYVLQRDEVPTNKENRMGQRLNPETGEPLTEMVGPNGGPYVEVIARGDGMTAPPPEHILQFFAYEHLPPNLQAVSRPFCELARAIVGDPSEWSQTGLALPRNPERTVALRKLLEAKDAAVRAVIAK